MAMLLDDENEIFLTIFNQRGQYSIWPNNLHLPHGWYELVAGSRGFCLDEIDQKWKDIRPSKKIETGY